MSVFFSPTFFRKARITLQARLAHVARGEGRLTTADAVSIDRFTKQTLYTYCSFLPFKTLIEHLKALIEMYEKYAKSARRCVSGGIYPTNCPERNFGIFCYFVEKNDIQAIKLLVNKIDDVDFGRNDNTPLVLAAEKNFYEIAELLLSKGASPNISPLNALTIPLLHSSIKRGNEQLIQLLLNFGADIRIKDWYGKTPMEIACEFGNPKTVNTLLKMGVGVDETCFNGFSQDSAPLHTACRSYNTHKNLELVELLLQNKANVRLVNVDGETALFYARY